jgi:hypothetical protein
MRPLIHIGRSVTDVYYGSVDLRRAAIVNHEQMRIDAQLVMSKIIRYCPGIEITVVNIMISPTTLKHLRMEVFEKCHDQAVAENYLPGRQFGIDVEVVDIDVHVPCPVHGTSC